MTTKTVKQVLIGVQELLSDPARFTINTGARNRYQEPVNPLNPQAICWCTFGGVTKVLGKQLTELTEEEKNLRYDVGRALKQASVELFDTQRVASRVNDEMGHQAIMKVLEVTIEGEKE